MDDSGKSPCSEGSAGLGLRSWLEYWQVVPCSEGSVGLCRVRVRVALLGGQCWAVYLPQ